MSINLTLTQLGLSDKEVRIFLALLKRGPSSVRQLVTDTKINRGTTYDVLKGLLARSLVSYYHKETKQYFIAEDPATLQQVVDQRSKALERTKADVIELIPELQSMYGSASNKPVAKYYSGSRGVKNILEDVLKIMVVEAKREYYVYSSADVRQHIYDDFPNFAKERVKKRIGVKTIALGAGGKLWGLDDRRWLSSKESSPSYQIIYSNKLALISLDARKQPHGVIIEDENTAKTQGLIFKALWSTLS